MEKFNYIISAYFGTRRCDPHLNDTEIFLDLHLNFLKKNYNFLKNVLNRVIVILNIRNDKDIDKLNFIKDKYIDLPIYYIVKNNLGGSYYNFEIGLLNSLILDPGIKYSFIVEDDWMPFSIYFYESFIKKIKDDNYIYISSILSYNHECNFYPDISNGIFDMNKVKDILGKKDRLFNLDLNDNYSSFEKNQFHFVDYIKEHYKIGGMSLTLNCTLNKYNLFYDIDKSSSEYCNLNYFLSFRDGKMLRLLFHYGNFSNELLFIPMLFENYFYRKMIESDIDFIFDKEISKLDNFYIINYNLNDIGYYKIYNYSQEFKSIYIDCYFIKYFKEYVLSRESFINFIYFLIQRYNINKFYFEFDKLDIDIYNSYKELGFISENNLLCISLDNIFNKFEVSVDSDKIYIKSKNFGIIHSFVIIYDINDNMLHFFRCKFDYNFIWYDGLKNYDIFKVIIRDEDNTILHYEICKRVI